MMATLPSGVYKLNKFYFNCSLKYLLKTKMQQTLL